MKIRLLVFERSSVEKKNGFSEISHSLRERTVPFSQNMIEDLQRVLTVDHTTWVVLESTAS